MLVKEQSRLSQFLGIPHIATRDIFIEELSQSEPSAREVTYLGFQFFLSKLCNISFDVIQETHTYLFLLITY